VDTRSGRSSPPPHARGEIPYWQIVLGKRISLVDLASRWLARKGKTAIEAVTMGALVGELAEHLAEIREVYPGRRWAPEILHVLLEALLHPEGSSGRGSPAGLPEARAPG